MATTIIPKAARGQSADMPNRGTANLPSIPFDDELPTDPAGNRQADRSDAYDDVCKESTRKLVKLFRGVMNRQGDKSGNLGALCDLGIETAASSGSLNEEALFRAIKLLHLDDSRELYEMHGVVEALIDRLPREEAEPKDSVSPSQSTRAHATTGEGR